MKLKLQDLNFSAHLFIYEQYGSLYPPGVAEEGELCWGICREHPSPGKAGVERGAGAPHCLLLRAAVWRGQEQLRQVIAIAVLHCY